MLSQCVVESKLSFLKNKHVSICRFFFLIVQLISLLKLNYIVCMHLNALVYTKLFWIKLVFILCKIIYISLLIFSFVHVLNIIYKNILAFLWHQNKNVYVLHSTFKVLFFDILYPSPLFFCISLDIMIF